MVHAYARLDTARPDPSALTERIYIPLWNAVTCVACFAISIWSWRAGLWPITVACWLPLAYFSHAVLTAFHEAAHGNLRPKHWDNEFRGRLIGLFALVPLSAYRVVHTTHHAHLAEPPDAELWPYCDPNVPRWLRAVFAWAEILLGYIVTPLLFLRGVLTAKISRAQREKVFRDYAVMVAVWCLILAAVHAWGSWSAFLMVFVIPAFLAGTVQTLRKFTEHLGLMGNEPETASRTIVDNSPVGHFLSATMLNVAYHTVHHRDASIPYYDLPRATAEAIALDPGNNPTYTSYWQAFCEMLPSLADPKVGRQWLSEPLRKQNEPPA
jgi:fatty acid desaturase